MKIVVMDGNGCIGPRLVSALCEHGHDAVAASHRACANGMLVGADVVVDASDAPACEHAEVVELFAASTRKLLENEAAAGVSHHVALSSVGTERVVESGYFRARCAQERLIRESGIPYSIVRATQVFEYLGSIADAETQGVTVRVPPALVQPIAAADVIRVLADTAVAAPLNDTIEVGGPEPYYLEELLERILGARNDPRRVMVDAHARHFGAMVDKRALLAGDEALLGEIRFDDWLRDSVGRGRDAAASASGEDGTRLEPNEFRVSDILPGSVMLLGHVAVFSAAGGLCATQALCTHRAGPLSEGAIDDTTVTCPLHGAQFNIWTGAVLRGPAANPLKTYRVTVDGDIGRVDID